MDCAGRTGCACSAGSRTPARGVRRGPGDMLLAGRFRRTFFWLWSTPSRDPLLIVVRADRPSLVERMRSLFVGESSEVEVLLDRRRGERRGGSMTHRPERRRGDRRRTATLARVGFVATDRKSSLQLDYTHPTRTKGDDRMISAESKQGRDHEEVRRWLESGQTQLASLLEVLHEHERLQGRVEASEREN